MFMRIGLILIAALLLPLPAQAAGSKNGKAQVSFHLQAEPGDSPKSIYPLIVHDQQIAFKRTPEIQTKDVVAYKAVPSSEQEGIYDIVVQLKPKAAQHLQMITNANRGRYLAAQINGRTGEPVLINAQINDGILVIWGVATAEDLNTLSKAFKGSVETN